MTVILSGRPLAAIAEKRLAEWGLALVLLLFGIILLQPAATFASPNFELMARVFPEEVWAAGCMAIGAVRLTVLVINGLWRRSPHLRVICAFLSIFVWTQVSLSFFVAGENVSTGLAVYPVFVLLDMISTYRAAAEARASDDRARSGAAKDGI